jgi:hypothetical protein
MKPYPILSHSYYFLISTNYSENRRKMKYKKVESPLSFLFSTFILWYAKVSVGRMWKYQKVK